MAVKKITTKTKQNPDELAEIKLDIIRKGIKLLSRRFDRALNEEDELDAIIDGVLGADMSQTEKNKLIGNIRNLELYDIKAITSVIGALCDKKAENDGEADGIKIDVKLPRGADDYAE